MNSERSWMYIRLKDGLLNPVFLQGIDEFIGFAKRHPECMDGIKIKCPCNHRKCQNRAFLDENTVSYHLMKYGFIRYYYRWIHHGESSEPDFDAHGNQAFVELPMLGAGPASYNTYEQMVMDAAGPDFSPSFMEEAPNATVQKLFDMLKAANQEVWPGCESHSQLSAVTRMLNMKAEHHLSERCFNDFCQFLKEVLPVDNVIPSNFKKRMGSLLLWTKQLYSMKLREGKRKVGFMGLVLKNLFSIRNHRAHHLQVHHLWR